MEDIRVHQYAEKLELQGYSKRVVKDYPAYLKLFLQYLEEHEEIKKLVEATQQHITGYHSFLQYKKKHHGKQLTSATVRTRLLSIKTFYRIMGEEGVFNSEMADRIALPKRHKHLPRHVPAEKEMVTLLGAVQPVDVLTTRDRAILELLYATGLRNEELRTLTIDDLDLTEKTLFVRGKGSKDRIVPIGDWVMPFIREYLEVSRPKLLNKSSLSELIFLSKNGNRITFGNLGDLIRKYAKKAGLSAKITPHTFRHACATHMLKGGADIRYVQELLGHSDLSSTQIYTRVGIMDLKAAHKAYHPREKEIIDG
jgi:integrase/recombinase XerD